MQKFVLALLVALFLIPAGSAFAQIDGGDFRLGLNGGLFSYTSATTEVDGNETGTISNWGAGFAPIGAAAGAGVDFGWTAGYAINPAIEVGAHLTLGFGGSSSENAAGEAGDDVSTLGIWLLPYFHYNLQVSKPLFIVFEAAAGYIRQSTTTTPAGGGSESSQVYSGGTFGPGIGMDFFLTKNASIDLMFNYQYGLLTFENEVGGNTTEADIGAHVIMFRLGTSIWMGGGM